MISTPGNSTDETQLPTARGLDLDRVHMMSDQPLALIVDDDADTVQLLKLTLQGAGINVIGALSGEEALTKCAESQPDIILLDLMMPLMDGWQTMKQLRHISQAPVVVISAIISDEAVVRALTDGAEDYVRKPYSAKEVVARTKATLRRSKTPKPPTVMKFSEKGLFIDLETRQVRLNDQSVKLSQQEYTVLILLAQRSPNPVPYEKIGMGIWGEYTPKVHKRLKWIIHQLRRKLEDDRSNPQLIINYWNYGYQLLT